MVVYTFFLLIFTLLCLIPLYLFKSGKPMTGRDLFFVLVGMIAMSLFSLVAIMT